MSLYLFVLLWSGDLLLYFIFDFGMGIVPFLFVFDGLFLIFILLILLSLILLLLLLIFIGCFFLECIDILISFLFIS